MHIKRTLHPTTKEYVKAHLFKKEYTPYNLQGALQKEWSIVVESQKYMIIDLLPENTKVNPGQKKSSSGVYWKNAIRFDINYQNDSVEAALDNYQNERVICGLETSEGFVEIYGNRNQPLKFLFEKKEGKVTETQGYTLRMSGDTYHKALKIAVSDFYNSNKLATWLAANL